jgi:hypothetical protein
MTKRKWIRVGPDLKPLPPPEPPRWEIDTREKAVAYLLQKLSPESREVVQNTKEEDLILFHPSSWGMWVRKELGLWGQNVYLLRDLSPDAPIHADDASMILIRAVWERLQQLVASRAVPPAPADRPRD